MKAAALLALALRAWALLPDEENTIKVFQEASPSVLFVTNVTVVRDFFTLDEFTVPQGAGSAFIWDSEGHVVTNFHVVASALQNRTPLIVTLKDGTETQARIVGVEPKKDIAVLKIDPKGHRLRPIPLGDSASLQIGQKAIAIGNPFGLDNTLTTGIVSALGRQVQGIGGVTIRDMIQTDAAINPGNSGGPLLDSSGRLIGMNTMIYSRSGSSAGIGFAVPVTFIRRVVPQIIKYGRAVQPGIGVSIIPARVEGVVVGEVHPNSPAEAAGMKGVTQTRDGRIILGDVIVAVDGKPVRDYDDLYNILDQHKVGDTVKVETLRRGQKRVYRIELVNLF
ncbi:MAG: trypsin-like peptidase domain-containing protein [Elusimicrobia bacterium]|nr:trypsin-like peptidase domain-containing protein [Elusimicrobiota bacterium]